MQHALNAAGLCYFGRVGRYFIDFLNAVTGWDYSQDELSKAGERIATLRHVFNLREGINPLKWSVHPRIIGKTPFESGPLAGVTADIEAQIYWNLGALDWDRFTTKPSKKKLSYLGLDDVVKDL
jgi:aldehyde:ferredoxin oxidoreductase